MFSLSRRAAVISLAALAMTACGQTADKPASPNGSTGATAPALQEMTLGSADAPVTMVEYASWTCPACLQFQIEVMPMVKQDYIETGKVRFVFREFPTPPANISVAGFALARCAGPDKYFPVLDELFERQTGILTLVRQGDQVKAALQQVGENHGISGEAKFDECLQSNDLRRAIGASVALADSQGVNSTPTVFIDGEKLEGYEWRTAAGMKAVLDAKLGIAPEPEVTPETPAETDPAATDPAPAPAGE